MSTVRIANLRKDYGAVSVLRGIDIDIEDGQFVVLVGPSGCGKSTLLRMIAGLEDISGGEIAINGRVVNDLPPKSRDIAMVFQNYALYPHMTVRENMAFSLKLRNTEAGETAVRVEQAAKSLGLSHLLNRYPKRLSGGQRQRVAMGRAVVRQPEVFLFDEPLSNLDAKLRVQMRTEIKQLHQRLSTTTVYVTHDQVEAMTPGDKVVVMRDGVIEQLGDPISLYDFPANQFVAGFLGSPAMNFFDGKIDNGGTMIVLRDGWSLELKQPLTSHADSHVVYGIRPGDIDIVAEGGVETVVDVVEPTGSETIVILSAPSMTDAQICLALRERISLSADQDIRIRPRPALAHVFSRVSGARIGC